MINLNDDTRLFPQVTFRVNTIRIHDILSWPQPDGNIQNIINNLKSQTIWVPNVPYPLKHGDVFSLYGKKALIAYNEYQQINATSNLSITLDLLYFGPPIPEATTTPEPTTTTTTTPEPTTTTTTPEPTTTTTTPEPTTTTTTPEPTTTTTTPEPTTTTTTTTSSTTTTAAPAPSDPALQIWYDAADPAYVNAYGGTVTQWSDKQTANPAHNANAAGNPQIQSTEGYLSTKWGITLG